MRILHYGARQTFNEKAFGNRFAKKHVIGFDVRTILNPKNNIFELGRSVYVLAMVFYGFIPLRKQMINCLGIVEIHNTEAVFFC